MGAMAFGLLWVVGAAVVFGVLAYFQQKFFPASSRSEHNDVAGMVFSIVGVLYTIVLAFVLISVWDQMNAAEENSYREANSVYEACRVADALAEPKQAEFRTACRDYVNLVIDNEWPDMAKLEPINDSGWQLLGRIRSDVEGLQAANPDTQRYQIALDAVMEAYDARQDRMLTAEKGISAVMWLALVIGGVFCVACMFLFGVPSTAWHVIMVASLAAMVALLLFAVYELEFPFSRDVKVDPTAFEVVRNRLA